MPSHPDTPSSATPPSARPLDRYGADVLAKGWRRPGRPVAPPTPQPLTRGLVVEETGSGFCGAVVRWENGLVVLEDRHRKQRAFRIGGGFLVDGKPVTLTLPAKASATPRRTASGSVAAPMARAKVAQPSRIYVEGRHDAELVEKIWGDDLRDVGVVVEYLGGIDDLPGIVADFRPAADRRLGVLVDHLVPGSKESRIAEEVMTGSWGASILITGHPFIDIWEAIRPQRIGLTAWPTVPRGQDWKSGICAHLGWPHADQADIARAWQALLSKVTTWTDLQTPLLTEVERLIDFVTA